MNKTQALHQFWNSFEIDAYEENSVPDDAKLPYITYQNESDMLDVKCLLTANIWYKSTSWKKIIDKAEEISKKINLHGHYIKEFDNGFLYITSGEPFMQTMSDPADELVKRVLLNITIEYLCSY